MSDSVVNLEGVRLTSQLKSTLLMLDIWNAVLDKGEWRISKHGVLPGHRDALCRRAARAAKKLGLVYRDGTITAK